MHQVLKEWKKQLDKAIRTSYYTPACDYCHEQMIMSLDEAKEVILFEPKEVEEESDVVTYDTDEKGRLTKILKTEKVKKKVIRSSDPGKDIYKFKCPYCGHIQEITRDELYKLRVSYYGDNNIRFELDDVETKRALEFMKKHHHKEEFSAQGKLEFSTLSQQFTYEIIPGGIGNIVVIKCNYCGEIEDITNTDNW